VSPAELLQPGAYAVLVLGAAAMPGRASRLRAATGLPPFLLGMASLPFLQDLHGPSPTLWISAALLLLGPVALLCEAWRSRTAMRQRPLILALVVGAAGVGVTVSWPLLQLGGFVPALLTTGALVLSATFLWLAAGAVGLGRAVRALDAQIPAPGQGSTYGTYLLICAATAVGLAALRWPLWVQLWQPVGIGVGAWAAWWAVATRRSALALAGAAFAAAFLDLGSSYSAWVTLGMAALVVERVRWLGAVLAVSWGFAIAGPLLGAEAVWTVLLAAAGSALLAGLAREESSGVA